MLVILPLARPEACVKIFTDEHLADLSQEIWDHIPISESKEHISIYEQVWRKFIPALARYGLLACRELQTRGLESKLIGDFAEFSLDKKNRFTEWPKWMNEVAINYSHQSYLLREFPGEYDKQFPDVPTDLPLIWTPNQKDLVQEIRAGIDIGV